MDSPETEVRRVAEALRDAIRSRRSSQRKVEQALHQGKGYLSQLLNGSVDLKLKHVFKVLEVIGIEPDEFFLNLYENPSPAGAVRNRVSQSRIESEIEELKSRVARLESAQAEEPKPPP